MNGGTFNATTESCDCLPGFQGSECMTGVFKLHTLHCTIYSLNHIQVPSSVVQEMAAMVVCVPVVLGIGGIQRFVVHR